MPKPVKKAAATKRPASDPNRRARQLMDEHATKMAQGKFSQPADEDATPPHGDPFKEQLSAYMSALGTKGGKVSGAKRMSNLTDKQRKEIARRAARARWSK